MPPRRHAWPPGHWDWYQHLAFKHGIMVGDLAFVGGQVDKDPRGAPCHVGDLATQTAVVVRHIDTVLRELGGSLRDVTKLVAFYATDGSVEESRFLADVGRHVAALGGAPGGAGPAITAVPLPWLALPGMVVEIEAIAVLGPEGRSAERRVVDPPGLPALPPPFHHGLACGPHRWVSGQTPRGAGGGVLHPGDAAAQSALVVDRLATVLAHLGADLADGVKLNVWFGGDGARASWEPAARVRAGRFPAGAPVALELPTPRLPEGETVRATLWAMRGADGRRLDRREVRAEAGWAWPFPLPYPMGLACGGVAFVGGQLPLDEAGRPVGAGNLVAQTRRALESTRRVLAALGLALDDMVKQGSFYLGESRPEVIVENQRFRSSHYTEPAGASTGVPLPAFPLEGVTIAIETVAVPPG